MKKFLFVVFLIAVSAFVSANPVDLSPVTKLRVAVFNGPSGVIPVGLMNGGGGAVEGLEIVWEILPSPRVLLPRLLAGDFEAAMLPSNLGAVLHGKGQPYRFAAVTGYGLLYVLSTRDALRSWADLKEKSLFLSGKGASPDYLARYFLKDAGLVPEEDVVLDYRYGHADLARAAAGGLVETVLLPEPFATSALSLNPRLRRVLDLQRDWRRLNGSDYPITILVLHDSLLSKKIEVRAFLNAMKDSLRWAKENPAEATALMPSLGFILDSAAVESSLPQLNLVWEEGPEARVELEKFFSVLGEYDPGSIGGSLPGDDWYLEIDQ